MRNKYLVTLVIGTRPEAIKLAPVIKVFCNSNKFEIRVILTGQHQDMVLEIFKLFNIKTNKNLNIMNHSQNLNILFSDMMHKLNQELCTYRPNLLVIQGDTSSAFAGALTAFNLKIPIAHVEAGLRTNDLYQPFPEEANRRIISQISTLHFAPTIKAAENLKKNYITENVFITGNTVIDALIQESKKNKCPDFLKSKTNQDQLILVTVHRRENWGNNLKDICKSILKLLKMNKNAYFVIPMHKNKIVRNIILELLSNNKRIILKEPLKYDELIATMKKSHFIMTDSGGIQEEAPSLGKPVLVLRNKTEREEAINCGSAKLVGTNQTKICEESIKLLEDNNYYKKMSIKTNPFGNGKASALILSICEAYIEEDL